MDDLIERMRSLEQDHEPEGWPAVQMRDISALCDALEATHTQRAPKGWKLVPVEPTPEMLISAQQVIYSYDLRVIFGAMLDAAPQTPAEQEPRAMTDLNPCWKCGSPGVIDENGGYQYAVCTNTRGCSNSGNWGMDVADWNRGGLTEVQELRQQLRQAKEESERVRQANLHTMDVLENMKAAREQAERQIAELVGAGNRLCYELESWLATEHDKESVRAMNIWRKVLKAAVPNEHQQEQAGNEGKERLWTWFSLSYASFLVLPRAGMHQMPDEWQNRMAQLLEEWDEAAKNQPELEFIVQGRKDGKLCQIPKWIRNYRHPDRAAWNHFFGRQEQCTYPSCNCPFDMGPDHQCLRGLPVIRK